MNKTALIAIAIILLLGLGFGGYVLSTRSQTPTIPDAKIAASPNVVLGNPTQKKSLKDLLTLSANQKCAFSDPETKSSGTVYIGSGDMRGDFQTVTEGKMSEAHMIVNEGYVYFWMDGQAQGFKSAQSAIEKVMSGVDSKSFALNKQVDYSCNPSTVTADLFVLPKTVEFADYSSLIQKVAPSGSTEQKAVQCAACDSLPPEAQAQCRSALSCK